MSSYINCGEFNPDFSYILLLIICKLLLDCVYGFNYNETFKEFNIFNSGISKHYLIPYIVNYFFTGIFGFLFYKYEIKDFKKSEKIISHMQINLIHNDREDSIKTNKFVLIYLFIQILWIIEEQLLLLFHKLFKDLDFWMIELVIISYIYRTMFNIKIYRHQNLAIILNLTLPLILKAITIIVSFNNKNILYEGKIPNLYANTDYFITFIAIIIYIGLISLRSYVNSKLKWYMDIKYISSNRILMFHGIIGFIFYLIITTVTTFIECGTFKYDYFYYENDTIYENKNYTFPFRDYICTYKINNTDNTSAREYFDKFHFYKETNWLIELIVTILGILLFFGYQYFYLSIIKCLTPIHLIFTLPIYYFFQKIILSSYTMGSERNFFFKEKGGKITKFSLDISGDISAFIGFLIYLEIIILNFKGFNYNIKKNIMIRSNVESTFRIEEDEDITFDLDNESKN